MKQLLYLLFFMNLYSFSQSIDLGNTGDIKKTFFTQDNKEMYVFFKDSISIIDIQNFTSTSKTFVNYPANDFLKNYKVISVNSEMVMASAKACKGCAVADSIFTIGTVAYFLKLFRINSDSSFTLFFNVGNALTAITSAY